jgi:hypothetical protein
MMEEVVQLPHMQLLLDDVEARRLLGMARAHLVQAAGRVGNEGHGHGQNPPAVIRDERPRVYR